MRPTCWLHVSQNQVWPSIGKWNTGHKRKRKEKKAFPTIKLHRYRNPHDSWCWQAAYSFLVFWCWRQRKGSGSFRSTRFFHKQLDSLAVSWKKSSISVHGCPSLSSFVSQTEVQLSQQQDHSDQPPLLMISIPCKWMTKPKTVMNSPTWSDIKLVRQIFN